MNGDIWTLILIFGITGLLVATNALFVFHEFAFVTLKPFQLRKLAQSETWLARSIVKAAHRLDHYIAVDQLGITAMSLLVGWISQPALTRVLTDLFEDLAFSSGAITAVSFTVVFVFLTVVQMIFGELIPKTIALRHPERIAHFVSVPVDVVAFLFHPLVVMLNGLGNLGVRAIGVTPREGGHQQHLPAEELEAVIERSALAGRLRTDPLVVRRTLHFSDLEARDIIVPRQDMVTVDMSMTIDALLDVARAHRFTRYPVTDGSIDNIVGLINVKELFQVTDEGEPIVIAEWHDVIEPIPVVPETASIEQVLQKLVDDQEQMMLLVDEFGGTSGILTVTDIAAEATGSSRDIARLRSGAYLITGESSVSTVESVLDLSLGGDQSDYETIAGLIMSVLGRIPATGDEITVNGSTLRVNRMTGRRVVEVVLTPPDEPELPEE